MLCPKNVFKKSCTFIIRPSETKVGLIVDIGLRLLINTLMLINLRQQGYTSSQRAGVKAVFGPRHHLIYAPLECCDLCVSFSVHRLGELSRTQLYFAH